MSMTALERTKLRAEVLYGKRKIEREKSKEETQKMKENQKKENEMEWHRQVTAFEDDFWKEKFMKIM